MLTAKSLLNLDPAFIQEVATGMEEPADIARRYGYTYAEWEKISSYQPFINEVNRLKAEFERSGQTFRLKAAVMAEKLLDDTFTSALQPDVPVKDKAVALQTLAKFADLEPKRDAQVSAGPGFSITITIPQAPVETIEAKPVEDTEAAPADAQLELSFGDGK
jgi:hypothetical protein